MKYCENCGAKLVKDSIFCEKCGTKILDSVDVKNKKTMNRAEKKTERKPLNKQQRIIGPSIVAIILFLIIGYNVGTSVYSEENQTKRITEALASKDAEKIAEVVTTKDSNFEVNGDNLEGFAEYLDRNPNYLSKFIKSLEDYGSYDSFYIEKSGTKFGLFDSYELVMTPVYGEVYTNARDVLISLGDKEIVTSDREYFIREIGPFAPGILTFKAKGKLNGFPLEVTEEVTWLDSSQDNEVDLSLHGNYFEVYSDLEAATVFVNGQSIGQLEDGYGEFGPIQIEEGMELHVGQTFDEEEIISETVELTEEISYYEFLDLVVAEEYDVSSLINSIYGKANTLSMNYDSKNVESFNQYFHPEGPAFEEQRTTLLSELKAAANNDDINNINFEVIINEVNRVGVNSFDVEYEASYFTQYAYHIDRDTDIRHYLVKATVIFEPINHPSRDFDSFIYEINNQELLYEDGEGGSIEDSSESNSETAEDKASSVVLKFVTNLPKAVNDNDFSEIASYIDSESSFYDQQAEFVTNTHEQGITEKLDSIDILEVILSGDDTVQVRTSEEFIIYNGDSENQSKYQATYDLKLVDGKYVITDLTID